MEPPLPTCDIPPHRLYEILKDICANVPEARAQLKSNYPNESDLILRNGTSPLALHTTSSTLRRLPAELRERVFEEAIVWNGKTPMLIIALRGDQQLYHEALEVLYRNHHFVLHQENNFSISELESWRAQHTVTKALVNLRDLAVMGFRSPSSNILNAVYELRNLKELSFSLEKYTHIETFITPPGPSIRHCLPLLRKMTVDLTCYSPSAAERIYFLLSHYKITLQQKMERKMETKVTAVRDEQRGQFRNFAWVWEWDE